MKWINFEIEKPPNGIDVLVVKTYLDAEYDEHGYHPDKSFWTQPRIVIDCCWSCGNWHNGGKGTHWMALPDLPKERINKDLYLNKNFIFPKDNEIEWSQDFMCYKDNIPHGVKFKLTDFHEDGRITLRAHGYGIVSKKAGSYGNGAISANIRDVMEYVVVK